MARPPVITFNSLQAKTQELWEWEDCIFYCRHLSLQGHFRTYYVCPQLASSKCFMASLALILSSFRERPFSSASCLAQPRAGCAEQLSPHRFKTHPLTFSRYSSLALPGQKPPLYMWKQQMRIPEIKVFICHRERIYIPLYEMKRLY